MNTATQIASNALPAINFSDLSQWKTLKEINELNPNIEVSRLKWLLRSKESNGLDKIIKKIGRLNLVHAPSFSNWISEQR